MLINSSLRWIKMETLFQLAQFLKKHSSEIHHLSSYMLMDQDKRLLGTILTGLLMRETSNPVISHMRKLITSTWPLPTSLVEKSCWVIATLILIKHSQVIAGTQVAKEVSSTNSTRQRLLILISKLWSLSEDGLGLDNSQMLPRLNNLDKLSVNQLLNSQLSGTSMELTSIGNTQSKVVSVETFTDQQTSKTIL